MSRLIAVAVRDDAASSARTMQQERIDADLVGWLDAFPHVGVTIALCWNPRADAARRLHHSADGIVVTRNSRGD